MQNKVVETAKKQSSIPASYRYSYCNTHLHSTVAINNKRKRGQGKKERRALKVAGLSSYYLADLVLVLIWFLFLLEMHLRRLFTN